jgi:hypothetical protein
VRVRVRVCVRACAYDKQTKARASKVLLLQLFLKTNEKEKVNDVKHVSSRRTASGHPGQNTVRAELALAIQRSVLKKNRKRIRQEAKNDFEKKSAAKVACSESPK